MEWQKWHHRVRNTPGRVVIVLVLKGPARGKLLKMQVSQYSPSVINLILSL